MNRGDVEMNFGEAIECLKHGEKVTRRGWNGKGMYLWMKSGCMVREEMCYDPVLREVAHANGGEITALPTICMYTYDGNGNRAILTGWLASQSDIFAEDWEVLR